MRSLTRCRAGRLNPERSTGSTEPPSERRARHTHLPAPSLWPIGFAIGVACILVGPRRQRARADRRRGDRARLRLPLGPRPARRAPGDRRGAGRARCAAVGHRGRPRRGRSTARTVPLARDDRRRRADRRGRHVPVLGFGVLPSFMGEGVETNDVDLGPISNFPEGEFVIATYLENPDQGEVSRRTAFIRNNGRADDGVAELHDDLQPLRPPRLPGAAERADRRGGEEGGQRRRAPAGARRELRLPVPRRPLRLRGQPQRRPARALARPLRVLDQGRQPGPRPALQRRQRRGHGREGAGSRSTTRRTRACTSTASSGGSTRSRPRGRRGDEAP